MVSVGLCFLLENAYSKLYPSLINELFLLCVCCVGICYVPLYMVFIEVWGSLDSEERTVSGFDSYPHIIIILSKSYVAPRKLALEVNVGKMKWWPGFPESMREHFLLWLKVCFLWPWWISVALSFWYLLLIIF